MGVATFFERLELGVINVTGLLYLLPLCLVVSIVYEATHEEQTSLILRKGLKLFVMLGGGIVLLAILMLVLGRML